MAERERWKKRFENYKKSLARLSGVMELEEAGKLTDMQRPAKVRYFEFAQEMALRLIDDFLRYQGIAFRPDDLVHKNAIRLAYKYGIVADGQAWIDMLDSLESTQEIYKDDIAAKLDADISEKFYPALCALKDEFIYLSEQDAAVVAELKAPPVQRRKRSRV